MTKRSVIREKTGVTDIGLKSAILVTGLTLGAGVMTACFQVLGTHLQPVDIKSRWRHNWKSAQVVNSHLVCYPTIRQPGFDLPRQQWSLLNRFRTEQGHCGACRRKWQLIVTILCPCGETQMMSHIVESCPPGQTEWRLISATLCGADEDAVSWLTSYGS